MRPPADAERDASSRRRWSQGQPPSPVPPERCGPPPTPTAPAHPRRRRPPAPAAGAGARLRRRCRRAPPSRMAAGEHERRFDLFGSRGRLLIGCAGAAGALASEAAGAARSRPSCALMHRRLTRFEPDSELSVLNADPAERRVGLLAARDSQSAAGVWAAEETGRPRRPDPGGRARESRVRAVAGRGPRSLARRGARRSPGPPPGEPALRMLAGARSRSTSKAAS